MEAYSILYVIHPICLHTLCALYAYMRQLRIKLTYRLYITYRYNLHSLYSLGSDESGRDGGGIALELNAPCWMEITLKSLAVITCVTGAHFAVAGYRLHLMAVLAFERPLQLIL
jgi:hypothetical protein